jgi:hypothetical protein
MATTKTILHVDSRDVNTTTYTLGSYRVPLPRTLKNVKSIELLAAEMPNVLYLVSSSNNKLDFKEGATAYAATLTAGSYTKSGLISAVQTAMNAAGATGTYTLTEQQDSKLKIASSVSFSLPFATGANVATSIHSTLGFASSDHAAATSQTATNLIDVANHRAVYLSLTNLSPDTMTTNAQLQNVFAKIPLNANFNEIVEYTKATGFKQKHNIQGQPTLIAIDVKWLLHNGTTIDFQGVHHAFSLAIEHEV